MLTDRRTDGRTHGRTDGRTDDGRKVITIAHPEQSSGELKIPPRDTVWPHEACPVMPDCDTSDRFFFLSTPHIHDRFFFLHTFHLTECVGV